MPNGNGCHHLTVEYAVAPHDVATPRPRFSWMTDEPTLDHEIEVRDQNFTRAWQAVVRGTETNLLEYAGDDLLSDSRYHWRVRPLSAEPAGRPWAESVFETSLLYVSDWAADWVEPVQDDAVVERWSLQDWVRGTKPDVGVADRLKPPKLLRQRFEVRNGLVSARLHATAHGVYSAWLNGAVVGDEVLAPGFDSYAHRVSAQRYDVTAQLATGANVLAWALADGWWAGRIGLTGSSAQFGRRLAAIWQLHLTYADGSTEVVSSGADVRCSTGPWAYADLFVGEFFDRRAEQSGWTGPTFDDGAWEPVTTFQDGRERIVPFAGEPIRRVATLLPVSIALTRDGQVVDFGQVIAGRVRLKLRDTAPGQRVTIEHTETLDANGEWFVNIVGVNKEQTDVFIAAGGSDEWEPEFTFHGFRYARVVGVAEPLTVDDLVAVVLSTDLPQTGSLRTSDSRLNRLHDNVVWSQRANFLSVPTDCPQRERAGWTGDIQVFAPASTNNAMVAPFLSRWLENLRADQLEDGRIPIISPRSRFDDENAASTAGGLGAIVAAAGWSDAIAIVPWVLYERYGDVRVLERNFDAVLRWVEYQRHAAESAIPERLGGSLGAEQRRRHALMYNTGDHFGDWLTPSTLEGKSLHEGIGIAPAMTSEYIAPMFQAQTLTLAARMADVLDEAATAESLREHAAAVRAAFAAEYIDEHGRLPVTLQGPHVLALAFDMVPARLLPAMIAFLVDLIHVRGDRLDTGFLAVPHILDVLWENGHPDLARRLLWQPEAPSWLYAVDRGATTIWESWDAIAPDGTPRAVSLNHYAFGCVDDFLFRRVAGIQPTAPGFRTVVIEPDLSMGLESLAAHVTAPAGRIAVEWEQSAGGYTVMVDVPLGISATLRLGKRDIPLAAGRSSHSVPAQDAGRAWERTQTDRTPQRSPSKVREPRNDAASPPLRAAEN
ncbi:alpha-L-rhamnosidase [Microbacterium aurantiacum]|uniref:alpha-L-rhamnosidase n=1 Tax=Microbacterium aurantiacum TaxID=162393 RepID=UPI0011AEFC94|nr:alpha-L-rhamnosidase [Microbacterium aurantiacum]